MPVASLVASIVPTAPDFIRTNISAQSSTSTFTFRFGSSANGRSGQAICVIDIKAFGEPVAFKRQVDAVIRQLHGSALLPGFDRIRLPGEDRHRRIAERAEAGIPIPPELQAALDRMADELTIGKLFG